VLKQVIADTTEAAAEKAAPVVEEAPVSKGLMSRMKKEGVQ
jgi:hypothetical protein